MFLLVAANAAELKPLVQQFADAGVSSKQLTSKTYAEVPQLTKRGARGIRFIVVVMSLTEFGWEETGAHLRKVWPKAIIICVYPGSEPRRCHRETMTTRAEKFGAMLAVVPVGDAEKVKTEVIAKTRSA